MNLSRKLLIPAIAAGAILAGTPAALAAPSQATASVATVPAMVNPAGGAHWAYWNSYPTLTQCKDNGSIIGLANGWRWKCAKTEEYGYEWVYNLYFWWG